MGWSFLSLLLSPIICLLALLLLSDTKYEATSQAREESRFRDQLAVLSDIKVTTQAPAVAPDSPQKDTSVIGKEFQATSQITAAAIVTQSSAAHRDNRHSEAMKEPPAMPATSAPQQAIATDPYLLTLLSETENTAKPDSPKSKRIAFNPTVIIVGILIIAVAILAAYIFYLRKSINQHQEIAEFKKILPFISYRVEEYCYTKTDCNMKRLIVNIDEVPLVGPSDSHMTIEVQKDFNGDGIVDAIISKNCGGSACLDEFLFVSVSEGKIVIAPVDINEGFNILEENGNFLVEGGTRDEIIYWGFDGEKAFKVRSVNKQRPLTTIESTALCLQNRKSTECPDILNVIGDDKKFKEKFYSLLKKSPLSESNINSFFNRGLTPGFKLLKRNGKQYLKTYWYAKSLDAGATVTVDFLIEIKGGTSGSENRLTALYDGSIWLNDPTDIEKDILSNAVPDTGEALPDTTKAEDKTAPPVEPKRNIWFTPESGFTECIEAQSGPAGRIEDSKGMNPSVVEKEGGRIVQVQAYRDQGRTIVTWMFYRDKAECESVETNVEKKLADKYR